MAMNFTVKIFYFTQTLIIHERNPRHIQIHHPPAALTNKVAVRRCRSIKMVCPISTAQPLDLTTYC